MAIESTIAFFIRCDKCTVALFTQPYDTVLQFSSHPQRPNNCPKTAF